MYPHSLELPWAHERQTRQVRARTSSWVFERRFPKLPKSNERTATVQRPRPSARPSVRPSVPPSLRPSVRVRVFTLRRIQHNNAQSAPAERTPRRTRTERGRQSRKKRAPCFPVLDCNLLPPSFSSRKGSEGVKPSSLHILTSEFP